MTGLHVVGFGATVQGHFEACALRRFWASLLPAAVVEVAVVIRLKSLLSVTKLRPIFEELELL